MAPWKRPTTEKMTRRRLGLFDCDGRGVFKEFVGPLKKVFHVRTVFVATVMLAPGEFTIKQPSVHRRHRRDAIVFLLAQVPCAQEAKNWTSRNSGHVAALLIEPLGVAAF